MGSSDTRHSDTGALKPSQSASFKEQYPPRDEGGKPTLDVPTISQDREAEPSAAAMRSLKGLRHALSAFTCSDPSARPVRTTRLEHSR